MEGCGMDWLAQEGADAIAHFRGGGDGVGEGKDLVGLGVAFFNQSGDAVDENRSFAGASAGDDEHGAVNVLDSFTLAIIGEKWGVRF